MPVEIKMVEGGKIMKILNLKSVLSVGVIAFAGLAALATDANAQGNSRWAHEKNRVRKEQKAQQKAAERYYRVYRGGSYYQTDYRGAELLRRAVNSGYQQGYQQGQRDRQYRRSGGYYGSNVYRSGSYGYQSYVDRNQYQYYFQQGFQRGYEDGYNSQMRYGSRSGNAVNIIGSILGSILNIREY
jgi:flagellar biosynthesis/type III secretory pathway protein FliH